MGEDEAEDPSRQHDALGAFTLADAFAGMGLMRLAMERCCGVMVWVNDADPAKRELYVLRFGADVFLLGDIAQVVAERMPTVDVLSASFPCIDLSLAGHRAGLAGRQSGAV